MSNIHLSPQDFQLWTRLIQKLSGISLDANKDYLIKERFKGLLEEAGCSSFSQLYFLAIMPENHYLRNQIIDVISTKETSFFRDGFPFEALQTEIIPSILKRLRKQKSTKSVFRVWSAGCSTGQELFSIAMILSELNVDAMGIAVELVGTDISHSVIAKAQLGIFSKFEIERGLSPERRDRFFSKSAQEWKVIDSLLQKVSFRQLNLLQSFYFPEKMDLILCRNVAIYFQSHDKQKIFSHLARSLDDDGYLILGTTENLQNCPNLFEEKKIGKAVFYQPLNKSEEEYLLKQKVS